MAIQMQIVSGIRLRRAELARLLSFSLFSAVISIAPLAAAKTPQEIFAEVSPSVVVIEVFDASGRLDATGSGVVVARGEVITNCHVASENRTFKIKIGGARFPAVIHLADRDRDLCQLSAPGLNAPPALLGDVNTLSP